MAELYCTTLLRDGTLKLYYRFEETSGTTVTDWSGNSMTGTASRTNILNNAGGQFGNKAIFVSASSDKVTLSDNSLLKPAGSFSLGCWIKTTTTPGVIGVLLHSYSQNTNLAGIRLNVESTNKVRILSGRNTGTLLGTDYQVSESTTSINTGAWFLVVGTYDGSRLRLYVNGVLEGDVAWANAAGYAATNYVRVGCGSSTGTDENFYDGSMDEAFLITGVALTQSKIVQLYSGGCDTGIIGKYI